MKIFRFSCCVFIIAIFGCANASLEQLHDGDLIFQTSRSNQSVAIQRATHSRYSHMGIIFLQDGKPFVFEASSTVKYTPLDEWISNGVDSHYVVKRLRDADRILTPDALVKLRQASDEFLGKPYDLTFEWSDERMYCSELVWKIYDRGIGLHLERLQKLRTFDLADPVVQTKLRERYGDQVPLEEKVISPGEMFSAEMLMVVDEN